MGIVARLPIATPCSLYRYEGTHHGCAVLGECKPIQSSADLSGCPKFVANAKTNRQAGKRYDRGPCKHLGDPIKREDGLRETVECKPCSASSGKKINLPVVACAVHGKCTVANKVDGLTYCGDCDSWKPRQSCEVHKVSLSGHYNCSIIEYGDTLLMASRYGFVGSRVFLSELDKNYQPKWSEDLGITIPGGMIGVEDPRLFMHGGRLHATVSGYLKASGPRVTRQFVVEFADDLTVQRVWEPQYTKSNPWEKNWGAFSHDGKLHFVYGINPHVVLRCDGEQAVEVARTVPRFRMGNGVLMRGGAAPVLVGDEWYSFYHTYSKSERGRADYGMALYTFSAVLPFAQKRYCKELLLTTSEDIPGWNKRVVFPCGAVLRDKKWIVSYGHQDRECRIAEFDAAEIERRLI